MKASAQLKGFANFRMVGDYSRVPRTVLGGLAKNIELIGSVRRDRMHEHYRWADVFLLPSVCEGSATVTYEAMQHGLPLIVTPNTGSVIEHGQEGLIVPVGEQESVVQAIEQLGKEADTRDGMAEAALLKAKYASYEAYSQRLINFFNSLP